MQLKITSFHCTVDPKSHVFATCIKEQGWLGERADRWLLHGQKGTKKGKSKFVSFMEVIIKRNSKVTIAYQMSKEKYNGPICLGK